MQAHAAGGVGIGIHGNCFLGSLMFLTAMYLYILDIATDVSFLINMSVLVCDEVDLYPCLFGVVADDCGSM